MAMKCCHREFEFCTVIASKPWKERLRDFITCLRNHFSKWNGEYRQISKTCGGVGGGNKPNQSLAYVYGMLTMKFSLDSIP